MKKKKQFFFRFIQNVTFRIFMNNLLVRRQWAIFFFPVVRKKFIRKKVLSLQANLDSGLVGLECRTESLIWSRMLHGWFVFWKMPRFSSYSIIIFIIIVARERKKAFNELQKIIMKIFHSRAYNNASAKLIQLKCHKTAANYHFYSFRSMKFNLCDCFSGLSLPDFIENSWNDTAIRQLW